MAKRGRKPKERRGYFYETEEKAIVDYINSDNEVDRNRIFNEILQPALTKMIESIIRRYKLYVPDEEFDHTFHDTASYLMSKISNFKPDKGTKAYSYCGTVCKNYLMYKRTKYSTNLQRNTPYDTIADSFENNYNYSTDSERSPDFNATLISETANEIQKMIENREENNLNDNEVKVGYALIELLNNWEDILEWGNDDSNKLRKSAVLYFLREATMMDTTTIRDNMKKYKNVYYLLKNKLIG